MFRFLQKIRSKKYAIDAAVINKEVNVIIGDVSLREMLRYAFSGEYVFHGSSVMLQPGIDIIKPGAFNRVYAGGIDIALRFALVRKYGIDQYGGTDFYIFCTRKHRLVIYNSNVLGKSWYQADADGDAYIYAIPAKGIVLDGYSSVGRSLPIVGRATVNQHELAKAGFWFVPDARFPTVRWWGIANTDENIQNYVLPAYPWFYKRQR